MISAEEVDANYAELSARIDRLTWAGRLASAAARWRETLLAWFRS